MQFSHEIEDPKVRNGFVAVKKLSK